VTLFSVVVSPRDDRTDPKCNELLALDDDEPAKAAVIDALPNIARLLARRIEKEQRSESVGYPAFGTRRASEEFANVGRHEIYCGHPGYSSFVSGARHDWCFACAHSRFIAEPTRDLEDNRRRLAGSRVFRRTWPRLRPVIEFEKALFERRLVHGGNPLLRLCVGNLVFMEDASGNRRPHKAKSIDRIDSAVAAIMSVGRATANATVSSSYVNEEWANGLVFA
jgi:hypothetical protein